MIMAHERKRRRKRVARKVTLVDESERDEAREGV
jgi:hypothetical protein